MKPLTVLFLLLVSAYACTDTTTASEMQEETVEQATRNEPYGGLALYTLRDTMAKNPRGVLQTVADMGYRNIEAAGYADGKFYGMAPAAFQSFLDSIGLTPMSSHHGDVTLENADRHIADAVAAGFTYFVIPIPPMGHFRYDEATRTLGMSEDVAEVSRILNEIADKCHAAGIRCLYHNHDFEFRPNAAGVVPMDYFVENSDPEKLNFQMDLYWVTRAGGDPVAYFEKYPGRWYAWHVKDMDDQQRFAPVGQGSIDFARILDQAEQAGMKTYFVEQDATFDGQQPIEAVQISHAALAEIGFE